MMSSSSSSSSSSSEAEAAGAGGVMKFMWVYNNYKRGSCWSSHQAAAAAAATIRSAFFFLIVLISFLVVSCMIFVVVFMSKLDDKHYKIGMKEYLSRSSSAPASSSSSSSSSSVVVADDHDHAAAAGWPFKFTLGSSWSTWTKSNHDQLLPADYSTSTKPDPNDLNSILNAASMQHNTVILTTLNQAWAEPDSIVGLFLESFRFGERTSNLRNHLVMACLDRQALENCRSVHKYCYLLNNTNADFSSQKDFRTPDYLKMMWLRIDFLRTVLELGFSFVFTDTDIMWFRNPFPRFDIHADFQIACDNFKGDPTDMTNNVNGGFAYVKSNPRTIKFYKLWYQTGQIYEGLHDQDVLNIIKKGTKIQEIGMTMRFLDTTYFGGFCEPSKDFQRVCTMHANCCVGLAEKIHDLKIILDDWKNYTASPKTEERLRFRRWRAPEKCRV